MFFLTRCFNGYIIVNERELSTVDKCNKTISIILHITTNGSLQEGF